MIETADIKKLTKISVKNIKKETIVVTKETGEWCKRVYPNHPKGCPNYGKKLCPPNAKLFNSKLSFFYLIYADFNLEKYVSIMSEYFSCKKVDRTYEQVSCYLYWQETVQNILKNFIEELLFNNNATEYQVYTCGSGMKIFNDEFPSMEASGINVFATIGLNKVKIDRITIKSVKLVCLVCSNKFLNINRIVKFRKVI